MFKKFKDYISNNSTASSNIEESQEELNFMLNNSIRTCDYCDFNYSINKGADINNITIGGKDKDDDDYYVSPLILCIIYDRIKMFKKLIDLNVDLINVISDDDIYDYIMKMMTVDNRKNIIKYIIEKHPDFMKDYEIRQNSKKYNI